MTGKTQNISALWFRASEATGDFMGIRYGRIVQGSYEVEWHFVSHVECDGVGGFARLLRERGAWLETLPQTKKPRGGFVGPLWRLWRKRPDAKGCANRRDWGLVGTHETKRPEDSKAVAWRLFTEEQTREIRDRCRRDKVTVNSFLLKHLDQAVRPDIKRPQLKIPWMVPVNLRGDVRFHDDTENHVSCVDVCIGPEDSVKSVHSQVLHCFEQGEHRANFLMVQLGKFLSHSAKVKYLQNGRSKPEGNIGAFSNLGVWDPEKTIQTTDSWLFCPPVVAGQLLGAGCVTFHNRLGIVIQGNPRLGLSSEIASDWMNRWVKGIGLG